MCRMVFFLAVNALILNGILRTVSPVGFNDIVLRNTRDFSTPGRDDLWRAMSVAYDYVRKPHTTPLYSEVFFNREIKFQYPPSALFAIAAMRMAGVERVRGAARYYSLARGHPSTISWDGCSSVMIISVAALLHIQCQEITSTSRNRSCFGFVRSSPPVSL